MIDTGAEVSAISDLLFAFIDPNLVTPVNKVDLNIRSACNSSLTIAGCYSIPLYINGIGNLKHKFYIINNLRNTFILGMDFIQTHGMIINAARKTVLFTSKSERSIAKLEIGPCINRDKTLDNKFNLSHLSSEYESVLRVLFTKHKGAFADSMMTLGCTSAYEHSIETTGTPVYTHPYKIPITQRPILDTYIAEMLANAIIRESTSPYSSSVVLVKKKSGDLRFCVDYRKLNSVTCKDRYPLPRIDDILDGLFGARYFSTLDLFSGFWQVKVKEEDKAKTAFTCEAGHFEFNRLPFGLCNAPATFQRVMNSILSNKVRKFALVYLDDIIVFSNSLEQHVEHLDEVFKLLTKSGLKMKPEKCEFAKQEIVYLGHIVSCFGVRPNPKKIDDVRNYPAPKNVAQLRTFLGLANYYRRFVRNFASIAHPLTQLTKQKAIWDWSESAQNAFTLLKNKLTTSPILGYPDFSKGYILHTDASEYGVGAVLSQLQPDKDSILEKEVVIAYTSKHLSETEVRWATIEKELYAIVHAVKVFHSYIYGQEISVLTDHKPLESFMRNKLNATGRLGRWSLLLQQFNLKISYRPGKTNQNADTLSRIPRPDDTKPTCSINILTVVPFPTESEFAAAQRNDAYCRTLIRLQNRLRKRDSLISNSELLTRNDRIIVPLSLRKIVIERYHDHNMGGHLGISKTLGRINKRFFWPNMRHEIKNYINGCLKCAKRKVHCVRKAPLEPIKPTLFVWQQVALDIVGPLPETYLGNRFILVMSEYTTRFMIATPLKTQTAKAVAHAFVENVILKYGTPLKILTDQGSNFMSSFFQEICDILNIKRSRTTAYHPESDGNVERFNRTMGDMLANLLLSDKHQWDELLPYVTFLYNTSVHSSTKETPHYLMFGQDPIEPDDLCQTLSRKRYVDQESDYFFEKWRKSIELARETFRNSQQSQKKFYDIGKEARSFEIGDIILLKEMRLRSKFDPRWIGPYVVTRKISSLNYCVRKKDTDTEYVVHVNRMKLFKERSIDTEKMDLTPTEGKRTTIALKIKERFNPETISKAKKPRRNVNSVSDDNNKENIDPSRSTKTRYSLRNTITKPIRYGIDS